MDGTNKYSQAGSTAMTVASKNLVAATLVALSALQSPSAKAEEIPFTPTLGNNSAYEFSSVSSVGNNTVTMNVYDKDSGVMKEVHYQVGLRNSTFGSGSNSKSHTIKLIDANVNVTSKYNVSSSRIFNSNTDWGNINKDFANLKITTTDSVSVGEGVVRGGAIHSHGIIGDVTGNFVGNYIALSDANATGGAIHTSTSINNIVGNFIGNHAMSAFEYSYGGAISNNIASINNITGDFIGNYAEVTSLGGNAFGGAIYTETSMEIVDSNFANNSDVNGANDIYLGVDRAVVDFIANSTSVIGSGIAGNGQFNKTGQGTLKLEGLNSGFVGTLTIKDGVLAYAKSGNSSYISGKTEIAENGVLEFTVNDDDSADLSNISGLGVLNKQGKGTINLVGDNSGFVGILDIDAGIVSYESVGNNSFFNANRYEIENNRIRFRR